MTARPLVIFGAGSLARLAFYYATREMNLRVLAFVVDSARKDEGVVCNLPVLTWEQCIESHSPSNVSMFVAVGYREMKQREILFNRAHDAGYSLQKIVSTSAFVADGVTAGDNSFIMPGVILEPGARIGKNNVVWSNSTICHDSVIGDHNFFASNVTIGGDAIIGNRCFFGFTSTVLHQCRVGDDVLLGAQSLLNQNAESSSQYQGVPAKKVREISVYSGVRVR